MIYLYGFQNQGVLELHLDQGEDLEQREGNLDSGKTATEAVQRVDTGDEQGPVLQMRVFQEGVKCSVPIRVDFVSEAGRDPPWKLRGFLDHGHTRWKLFLLH